MIRYSETGEGDETTKTDTDPPKTDEGGEGSGEGDAPSGT